LGEIEKKFTLIKLKNLDLHVDLVYVTQRVASHESQIESVYKILFVRNKRVQRT